MTVDDAARPDVHQMSLDERLEELWRATARDGGHLHGEPTLATELSTSRPAVREALIRLEERGYILRRQGARTVVNTSLLSIPIRFDQRLEAFAMITAMGAEPSVEVLDVATTAIRPGEVTEYDLRPSTQVYRVTKRFCADGMPVLLARDAIPIPKATGYADPDPQAPLVDLAEHLTGQKVGWETVWPSACALDAESAGWAGLSEGEPALLLEMTGIAPSAEICYWTRELHLRGFFRYAMVRLAEWR